jgi:Domain of unknown function (DUF4157)
MSTEVQIPMKPAKAPGLPMKPAPSRVLQRKCACGGSGGSGGECEACRKKKLQRSAWGHAPEFAPPIVHDVLRSPGQPLDAGTRQWFEPRFGHDFGKVRIHADERAGESAQSVNALAYTVGPHIAFASGLYQPRTASGQQLLAHELTHVTQQNGSIPSRLAVDSPASAAEQEAHAMASRTTWAASLLARTPGEVTLQRQGAGTSATGTSGAGKTSSASPGVGNSLCAAHGDELYFRKNPGYCQDTASSGSLHPGFRCYREIPTGSGCPAGKHVCFDSTGKCDPGQSHIDATAPSISRDPAGMCNLSWLGLCSLEHFVTDVIPDLLAEGETAKVDCIDNCQKTQPLWSQGFCMEGCTGGAPF